MSGRLLTLFFLCVCATSGCESTRQSQTTAPSEDRDQSKIIPQRAAVPARKLVIANLPNSVFGDYDSALANAVQNRWEELLKKSEHRIGKNSGQVTVKFKLHPDGSISELAVANSTLNPDLDKLSQAAIAESAPFGPWPDGMKAKIEGNFRELTFTFRYY